MKEKLKSIISIGKEFGAGIGERRLIVYATSGCYYMFMSLVPIVMILCCILPYTPFNLSTILAYIDEYFAESLGQILRNIANAIYSSNSATLTISIILTLYSASASMKALMKGMDSAYQFKNKNNIVVFTLRALAHMVLLVVTLLISLVIMVYGGKILNVLKYYFMYVGILGPLLSKGRYLMVMVFLAVVFTILFKIMPDGDVKLKDQIPGAIFSSVVWVIFSWIFTIYINVSNKFGAFGFIGTIMVAMMWINYCLLFLLIGGYMNSFLTARKAGDGSVLVDEAGLEVSEFEEVGSEEAEYEKVVSEKAECEETGEDGMFARSLDAENSEAGSEKTCGIVSEQAITDKGSNDSFAMMESGINAEIDSDADWQEDSEESKEPWGFEEWTDDDDLGEDAWLIEDDEEPKKKRTVPLIIGAVACAIAAVVAVFFIFKKNKSEPVGTGSSGTN